MHEYGGDILYVLKQTRGHGGALVGLAPKIETWYTTNMWSFG